MWYLFKHGPEAGKGLVGKLGKSDIENFARCLNQNPDFATSCTHILAMYTKTLPNTNVITNN